MINLYLIFRFTSRRQRTQSEAITTYNYIVVNNMARSLYSKEWRKSTYRRKKIFPGIFESRLLGEWAVLLLVRTKTANIQRTRVCLTTTLPLPTFYKIYFPKLFSRILRIFSTFFFHYPTQKILTDGNHTTSIFYKICSASSFSSCIKFWYPLRKSLP